MKEDRLKNALEEMVEGWNKQDELDKINDDIKSVRALFLLFTISVVVWAAAITAIIYLIK